MPRDVERAFIPTFVEKGPPKSGTDDGSIVGVIRVGVLARTSWVPVPVGVEAVSRNIVPDDVIGVFDIVKSEDGEDNPTDVTPTRINQ